MAFTGTISGIEETVRALGGFEDRVMAATFLGVQRGVLGGQSIVRGNASGRPGLRAPTGDFRRSIVGDAARSGTTVLGQIGTNAAQGRRAEFGFNQMTDRLNRYYEHWGPFPFLQPSMPGVRALLGDEVVSSIRKALS